jgi:rare lipoprotein A
MRWFVMKRIAHHSKRQLRRLRALKRFRVKRKHLRTALMATAPPAALLGFGGMQAGEAPERTAISMPVPNFHAGLAHAAGPPKQPIGSVAASYYGDEFAGRRTANGELFNPSLMTAAHRTLPFGSLVEVKHPSGRSVVVRINDRGPFHGDRGIDLSEAAAKAIGLADAGVGKVDLSLLRSA